MRVIRAHTAGMVATLLALTPGAGLARLDAQDVRARLVVAAPHSSTRVEGIPDEVDGLAGGLAVDVRLGELTLSASGVRGSLDPTGTASGLSRNFGDVSLGARYRVRSWLDLGAQYTARAFSSAAGHARWDMMGVGATASMELGTPSAIASLGVAWMPSVALSTAEPGNGLASELAVSVEPVSLPVHLRLHYRIERFFDIGADRGEQFESFAAALGIRLRRENGRWQMGPQ